ncbi:MAG: hypothetical protein A2539_07060 [Elusimicrobia bacterium RIFOXYD2_FULL_34_15]|nr:MAG: hypothetical protein A2539_07060 [Elusimicrobia bacterium RIFOXYD2_FULL_34_15]
MKKIVVFLSVYLMICLLINRLEAMSCHEGNGGHQHEEKSIEKSEKKKVKVKESFYSKIYVCPMHPEVRSDKPGKCSECGMKLKKKQVLMTYACTEKGCDYKQAKPGICPEHNKGLVKKIID